MFIPYLVSGSLRVLFTHPGSRIQGSKRPRIPDPGSGSATLLVAIHLLVALHLGPGLAAAGLVAFTLGTGLGCSRLSSVTLGIGLGSGRLGSIALGTGQGSGRLGGITLKTGLGSGRLGSLTHLGPGLAAAGFDIHAFSTV